MKDIIVADSYRVDYKIGEGGFGLVYSGTDLKSGDEIAIKLSSVAEEYSTLARDEHHVYKELSGGVGIPRVWWFGQECDFYALVFELLGPSLEDLLNYCDRKLSLKTILLLADQAISRIQYIHKKGFLHRDLKPENFLMGMGKQGNTVYLIDFGIAKELALAERDKDAEGLGLGGTREFASINNHKRRQQSRRDDLESLGYIFVYLAHGSLPWGDLSGDTNEEVDEQMGMLKESLSGEALCDGVLPKEFATYIDYTRSLGFDDKPDYAYLRELFRRLFKAKGFKYDKVFDWTEKLFYEMQSSASGPAVTNP